MPIPVALWILGGIASAALVTAFIYYWPTILDWARKTVVPFLRDIHPDLAHLAEELLVATNKIVGAVRRTAKALWKKLLSTLISVVTSYTQKDASTFLRKTEVITTSSQAGKVRKRVEEEEISIDDLPEELQAELIRRGAVPSVDVLKKQEEMIYEM
jgi:hypothetical protein